MKYFKALFAICWDRNKWRWGFERVPAHGGPSWLWLMLGPIAFNLGFKND